MYLAGKLHKEMDELLPPEKFIGNEVTYTDLSKMINALLKPYNAKGRVARDRGLNKKKRILFDISGIFHTDRNKFPVTITLHVPQNRDSLKLTRASYNLLRFDLSRVIQHEFIHLSQFTFRPEESSRIISVSLSRPISKTRKDDIVYLSERCEVEAYAHDIALEIQWFYADKNPYSVIRNIDKYRLIPSYKFYKKVFKGTKWERVKKALLRKVVKWIPSAKAPARL